MLVPDLFGFQYFYYFQDLFFGIQYFTLLQYVPVVFQYVPYLCSDVIDVQWNSCLFNILNMFNIFKIFQIVLEICHTSKTTTFGRLQNTSFCRNVVPTMGTAFWQKAVLRSLQQVVVFEDWRLSWKVWNILKIWEIFEMIRILKSMNIFKIFEKQKHRNSLPRGAGPADLGDADSPAFLRALHAASGHQSTGHLHQKGPDRDTPRKLRIVPPLTLSNLPPRPSLTFPPPNSL